MASGKTLALVTGANQGIGFAVSKRLASEHGYRVIMTGRREDDIKAKAKTLQDLGLHVEAHVMEITSDESIDAVVREVEGKFGHLDVPVNNAGISRAVPSSKSVRAEYEALFATNVVGSLSVTEKFLPLLSKSQATKRVVFVSSGAGCLTQCKTAVNALCVQYAVAYEDDESWKFNCCCPGYCATNLNGYRGVNPPETGAEIICYLATLGEDGPTGTSVNTQGPIAW
ncbi:short chain dehydrogenase reductase [Ilyonectria destructans]|nr:short chain dehydrogenase reductase [Ilyonectria destructans]